MARNQDRQFSESESLKARDTAGNFSEGEERLPAWASQVEDERQSAEKHQEEKPALPQREAVETPLRQSQREEQDSDGEREATVAQASARKEQAEEAWNREAKRVESTQPKRARRFVPENGEAEEEKEDRKASKPSRNQKKAGSKKKDARKKKRTKDEDERRGFIRTMAIIGVCTLLFLMVALMVLSNFISHPLLALPRKMVTAVITPVQTAFSNVTNSVVDYLRKLKIRGNIEYEYDQLTILLDDYATQIAQNEELRRTISSLYDQLDEQDRNRDMNPLFATVIGNDSGNYFATLDLDVGSRNGVTANMAVVAQGGLVGVTYDVAEYTCKVSCIISTDCTVAALVQSSRDQGSVKGTLGVNGEPMCRMYYLPDNSLPRPGDVVVTSGVGLEFPKGIPVGYIRESTRGMEDNKSYVVLEPVVDFQHLEYVTVYRYKPTYAESAQSRSNSTVISIEPLSTPRPVPDFEVGGLSDFLFSAAPAQTETPEPEATATPQAIQPGAYTPAPATQPGAFTPAPATQPGAFTPAPATQPGASTPVPQNLEYRMADNPDHTPTPSPRPTFTPTPSPVPTPDPGAMTVEDDE